MMKSRISAVVLLVVTAGLIAGCTTADFKRKVKYENVQTLPPLEVPPDLAGLPGQGRNPADAAPRGTTTYSEYARQEQSTAARLGQPGVVVLPKFPDVRIERAGSQRWLVVNAPPAAVWPKVREFVLQTGLLIDKEDAAAGVIHTGWADNRAKVSSAEQGLLAKWFGSLYSTGERDMYRIRLERGAAAETTEVFIAHYGMEEVIASNDPTGAIQTRWQRRAADPELEAEMLALLMVQFGVALEEARHKVSATRAPERAALREAGSGVSELRLNESLDRAWHRVSVSLDRVGFMVQDSDREKGVYVVRYTDIWEDQETKNIFQKIFGGKDEAAKKRYQIRLTPEGERTDVQVLTAEGAPEDSGTGERILSLLYEQLK